jgi:bifunctional UDP-N-acetylglucosamine pyrophosphorylase/glucosamine-1-phosphate N-acetyltransferase
MRSPLPKVLVPVAGKALVRHVLDALGAAGVADRVVVIGHRAEEVRAALGPGFRYALQPTLGGMAHAVACAREAVGDGTHVVVTVGDAPLLRSATLRRMLDHHLQSRADCTFLCAVFPEPLPPYARVVRDAEGRVVHCVEERDATTEQRTIRELLTSQYVFSAPALWAHLDEITAHPVTGERYLTDIVSRMLAAGRLVEAVRVHDPAELTGPNTLEEVRWAEEVLRTRADDHE